MADARTFPVPVIVGILLILVGGGAAGVYVYLDHRPLPAPSRSLAAVGDNVTVNYIGIYGSGPDAGTVFDTSLYSVASNGALWPKALEYQSRGGAGNYSPLDVHVGGSTPSGGYSVGGHTYIQVVPGFWQGLVGLGGNATRSVVVPPALGYGPKNPACLRTLPLVQQLPVLYTMTRTQFGAAFPGTVANTGATVADPHYGWPVLILSANASSVTLENLAQVGAIAHPYGWPVLVTNVTSTPNGTGRIALLNELTSSQAGHVLGTNPTGGGACQQASNGKFIVTSVDPGAGTYVEDYNTEVTGQTLIFLVTIVDIHRPAA
jgi:FKBP-type peptidyl-prolyl cis-trans isomerase 2